MNSLSEVEGSAKLGEQVEKVIVGEERVEVKMKGKGWCQVGT